MTSIYNPQQLEVSENTYVTAIAFSTSTGVLTATRNDGVELTTDLDDRYVQENTHTTSASFSSTTGVLTLNQTDPVGTVTVDLDGRFPTENTHLDTAILGSNNVLSLGMVNPTSTITVDLSNLADLNTHLDSASFSSSTKKLTLNMVNPTSQIEVDLSGIEGANTYVTSANFTDGTLELTRNDSGTVSVDLDGRYATQNTHVEDMTFNTTTRELKLDLTDPTSELKVTIPGGPDENTYLTELAFNKDSGGLVATLNNDDTVSTDLDGRYNLIGNNTHLNSASFVSSTGTLQLNMVNPSSQITVDISSVTGENTHLDSASFNSSTKKLTLNMVNPSSQIEVDLSGIEGPNTFVNAASFTDGTLILTRNDSGTVSVDLDGRYATQNTHLDDVAFNTSTRELTLDMVNPTSQFNVTIPGGPDENTFLSSLAFNTDSGGLTATLNNGTTVSTDLDGRYITEDENTHLSSATYNTDTSVLRLSMVNPASNIDVTIETEDQLNTHLDSASVSLNTLHLNMVNPSSQIDVDLGSMFVGKYLPITFVESDYSGNMNDLLSAGVYKVASTALNAPPGIEGNKHFVQVYSDKTGSDSPTACVQIWTTGMNQGNGINPNTRMWMRIFSIDTVPIVSSWQEINNGGINGYLKGVMIQTGRDFNAARYRQSGYYFVDNVNSETQGWTNGPSNFPDSQYNVLKTVMTGYSPLDLSYGNGYQELSTATYDTANNHVRTWKRSFEASSSVENYTEWYEVFHQGIPIELEVQKVTNSIDSRRNIDVSNVRILNLNLGLNYLIWSFTNGVEGQIVTVIKTVYSGFVQIWHWDEFNGGNIVTPTGPQTAANLRYHRSCSFIKVGTYWYPYNWESSSS